MTSRMKRKRSSVQQAAKGERRRINIHMAPEIPAASPTSREFLDSQEIPNRWQNDVAFFFLFFSRENRDIIHTLFAIKPLISGKFFRVCQCQCLINIPS